MNPDGKTMSDTDGAPIVFAADGRALARSRDVATYFARPHRSVLRSIRGLLTIEPSLDRTNFVQIEVPDVRGRSQPSYDMDRDGFTLLAMGFTGLKALRFKIAYINAFNRMEETLRRDTPAQALLVPASAREFPDWPLEEMRAKKATADLYRLVYGPLSAQWIMPRLGFPVPPRSLVRYGVQLSLFANA